MQNIPWERLIDDIKDKENYSINRALDQIPMYIKSYPNFYNFIKAISNYVMLTWTNKIEQIFNYLTVDTSKADTLNLISNKLNVAVTNADKYSYLKVVAVNVPENISIPINFELTDSNGNIWVSQKTETTDLVDGEEIIFKSKQNKNIYLDKENNGKGFLYYNKENIYPNKTEYPEFINYYESENTYEIILKVAIKGASVKRASNSGRQNLKETLEGIFEEIYRVDINDKALNSAETMRAEITIYGNIESYTTELVEKYLLPNITGVSWTVVYVPLGKDLFGFDRDEPLESSYDAKERGYGIVGWDKGEFTPIKILS